MSMYSWGVFYALFVALFVHREMKLPEIQGVLVRAAKTTAIVMFLCAGAQVASYMITLAYLPLSERVPKTSSANPLDAAPVGIGIDGGSAELMRVQVYRDIYYIAQGNQNQSLYDYREISSTLRDSSSPANNERYAREVHNMSVGDLLKETSQEGLLRNAILTNPTEWAKSPFARNRQVVDFPMQEDWYFPMGDNSSASADARSWGHTPERLMIGRAVMVFWPHYWNAPIPFVPNVQRMGLIR
jgi:signal peptidase I